MRFECQPPAGTPAIVQTSDYQCLAIIDEEGDWVDAYNPDKHLPDVLGYRVVPSLPPQPKYALKRLDAETPSGARYCLTVNPT